MVVTKTHAEDQGQRSFGSENRVETENGRTDRQTEAIAIALPPVGLLTLSVKIIHRNSDATEKPCADRI